jgi:hypothetical protein
MIGIVLVPNPLHPQIQEEALHDRVVPAIALAAHAAHQAMLGKQSLPMPFWSNCSASNWLSQRLTALSPSFMSLQTWAILRPWALTIWTTCSLKLVSKTLLDFGLLTVYAISVLTTYRAVCFY